jgi:hypothetical protein
LKTVFVHKSLVLVNGTSFTKKIALGNAEFFFRGSAAAKN